MDTGLLGVRSSYTSAEYIYLMGGDGTHLVGSTGRKGIDCSHQVKRLLDDAGYSIPYKSTSQMAVDTQYYDLVSFVDAQPGDIALWVARGHTGVFVSFENNASGQHVKGRFFGAQSSTGPAEASFGGSAYWPVPEKVLRPKAQYRSGAQPAPDAAPAPAPATPAPTVLMNFEYPIRGADGSQFKKAEDLYKILEVENSGHYLLGSNKFWHGGIHITDKGAPQCQKIQPIRCIADGVVVAYRLDQDYLQSQFEGADGNVDLSYSNSFCLVRHDYKSPANTTNGGKQNSLTFYSLYMHLLPYARYVDPLDPTVNVKIKILEGGYRAHSKMPGSGNDQILGVIPPGVEFEILDQQLYDGITYAKGKIISGNVPQRHVGDEIWFGYKKTGEIVKSNNKLVWQEILPPERTRPGYWQGEVTATVTAHDGLPLFYAPTTMAQNSAAGAQQGSMALVLGSRVKFDSGKIYNLQQGNRLRQMAECTFIDGGLREAGTIPPSFWLCIEDVGADKQVSWSSVVPTEFDKVITVNTGIKAGSPIGYLGLHEVLSGPSGGKNSKYQVHLEVFTADANIEDFLNNAAGLTQGKQYLSLSSGATLSPKPPATVGSTLVDAHALELANAPVFKDSASVEWYEVSVKDNGEAKTGLVKKQDAIMITQHDWKKLGFTVVQENDTNADGFLDPENMPQFFQDIYKKIDNNQDGDVDPGELTEALKDEETRSHWSKLVAYHPTEWKDKSSAPKWSRLNTLLETTPKVLLHEQERIDRTVFWDELGAAAPVSSGLIWHFHSVAFIENFLSSTCIPLDKAKEIALLVSSGYEGHDKLDYEALAGNFDGQGMSFGVIQWNFGQGTLGPVLLEMRSKDQAAFDGCFGANMNFQTLLNSLSNADKTAQMNWAIGIMSSNNVGWKAAFKKIGQNEDFQKIQLAHAAKYNDNVISCIKLMREVAPNLMVKVQLRTYCALYDLCVQQNNLKKAEDLIHEEFSSANITTQKDLLIFVCKKRAETASTAYRADAFSRRMGIILGQKYTATLSGVTASRENGNYSNIVEGDVCEL